MLIGVNDIHGTLAQLFYTPAAVQSRPANRDGGGPNPEGEGWVPNITQHGLRDYSDKDIAYLLETGNTPEGDSVGGAMTPVIRNTSQLSAESRDAMAAYIKSLPAVEGPKKPEKAEKK